MLQLGEQKQKPSRSNTRKGLEIRRRGARHYTTYGVCGGAPMI